MREKVLLITLLSALSACQPETPAQQVSTSAPAVVEPAPVQETVAAAVVEKAAQPEAKSKPAAETGDKASKPAVVPATVAKVTPPTPVQTAAAAAKPEVKADAAVFEADALQLAKKNNCLACHAIDRKVVGPAWKEVATKYRADGGAEAMLMNKIAKGGGGVWGSMAMPSYPQVSEADRRILARFVLSLK